MAAWVVAVAVVTAPDPIPGVPNWLDGSWTVGLDMASRQHLPMGSRLFFTYGPYGFLDSAIPYFGERWLMAMPATALMHLALVASIAVLLRMVRAGWLTIAMVSTVAVIALPRIAVVDTDISLLLITLGTILTFAERRRTQVATGIAVGALCALALLVKVSGMVIVGGALLILLVAIVARRRWHSAAAIAAGLVVTLAVLWWGAGLGAADLPRYLRGSWEITSGYAAARNVDGVTPGLIVACLVLVAFVINALVALRQRRPAVAVWMLLTFVVLFAFYKDDFIADSPGREANFFGIVALMTGLSLAVVGLGSRLPVRRWHVALPATALVPMLVLGATWRLTDRDYLGWTPTALGNWVVAAHAVVDSEARVRLEWPVRKAALKFYSPVVAAASLPPGAAVDFFGGDVGYFYYDQVVRWAPRPVLQSYQAYTPWLDQQDAAFYAGDSAPTYVIFRYVGLENRYAPFDEPATMRVLLERYRFVKPIDNLTVLLKRDPAPFTMAPERAEGRACGDMGSRIAIPQLPGRWTFGRLDMHLSLPGHMLDLALKPAQADVALATQSSTFVYRLVWTPGGDGMYLSGLVADAGGMREAFERPPGGRPLTGMTITSSAAWEWNTPVCVDFFSVPLPTDVAAWDVGG
jgi:hypothetical protein